MRIASGSGFNSVHIFQVQRGTRDSMVVLETLDPQETLEQLECVDHLDPLVHLDRT